MGEGAYIKGRAGGGKGLEEKKKRKKVNGTKGEENRRLGFFGDQKYPSRYLQLGLMARYVFFLVGAQTNIYAINQKRSFFFITYFFFF